MSAITPQTELRLLKCPLESDNKNQLTFTNITNQYNYFNSLPKLVVDNFTYQRHEGIIRYPEHIDNILQYNYVMYQNEAYSNKWFYAFITDMKYINDHMTSITIKQDVFQTWQFELQFKASFVEREHVNNDGYYQNLVDEGLPTGDYINAYASDFTGLGEASPVLASTVSPVDGSKISGGVYGGVYSGSKYYLFNSNNSLSNGLNTIANAGGSEGITGLFLAPNWLTGYSTATFDSKGIAEVNMTTASTTTGGIAIPLRPTTIDGYTPKNKKVFNYPNVCYVLSNNAGNEIELKLQNFKDNNTHTGDVNIYGSLTPGCSIRAIPQNYLSSGVLAEGDNNEYGLTMGKFPICSYPVDMYTNWLTQNSINIGGVKLNATESGIARAGASILTGVGALATGATTVGIGAVGFGVREIFNTLQEDYQRSLTPDEARGNTNSGDVTYAKGLLTFTGYLKTIRGKQARIIDDYYTMFGYKVNTLKVPNITGRSNWNYVKTIEANVEGNVPQSAINEIKSMLDNGVTFWHNTNYFLDYTRTNSIV